MSEPVEPMSVAGILAKVSEALSAMAEFLYNHIGLTLTVVWCFFLFAATEWAKTIFRKVLKDVSDQELATKSMPPVLGAFTGYVVFPAIMSTTRFGGGMEGWAGIGFGFGAGFFTTVVYDITKNRKFIRFWKVVLKKSLGWIPFFKLTEEEIEFIDTTTRGKTPVTPEDLKNWDKK